MCTLALYRRVGARVPLVVAANRDEFLDRPTAPPRVLSYDPWVVAGRDLEAGGTWLGLNERGLVAGLLNRRSTGAPDPTRQSRGILTLRVLQCQGIEEVEALLAAERGDDYNPFTLLAATLERAVVAVARGGESGKLDLRELRSDLHVLTNLEVDDPSCPRIAKSHRLFDAVDIDGFGAGEAADASLEELRSILSSHSTQLDPRSIDGDNSLCVHRGPYGTRSSTVIALDESGDGRYWHADGAPCQVEYASVELPRSSE